MGPLRSLNVPLVDFPFHSDVFSPSSALDYLNDVAGLHTDLWSILFRSSTLEMIFPPLFPPRISGLGNFSFKDLSHHIWMCESGFFLSHHTPSFFLTFVFAFVRITLTPLRHWKVILTRDSDKRPQLELFPFSDCEYAGKLAGARPAGSLRQTKEKRNRDFPPPSPPPPNPLVLLSVPSCPAAGKIS